MSDFNSSLRFLKFRNCKRCGKPFSTALSYTVCPECMKAEEETYNTVRDYLEANPSASEDEIIEGCNIEKEELFKLIRVEKIILTAESPISYPCESCGANINRGHFCLDCKEKLNRRTFR